MLPKEEFARYRKQIMLDDFGLVGQLSLREAKVLVVGAGGLGCPVLQYLVAAGVGEIGIVDFDVVEVSNLHRQVLYNGHDIGKSKVEVAIQKLSAQNPLVKLKPHPVLISEENAASIIGNYDLVIDGCDNFPTRYTVNDVCVQLKKPLVYGSILGYEGQLAVFNYEGSKNLCDLFSEAPAPEDVPDCSENGVLGVVPAIIGGMMALEAINVILKRPALINTFLVYNCLTCVSYKVTY